MMRSSKKHLIFDLGGVFLFYQGRKGAPIAPIDFKAILDSPEWHSYECGRLAKEECFLTITDKRNLGPDDLQQTLDMCLSDSSWNEGLITLVRELKALLGDGLKVHAASNISHPDFLGIQDTLLGWNIFDSIYTSAEAGLRKPDRDFYLHVLEQLEVEASDVLFIDDNLDNVIGAGSLGIHSLQFKDHASTASAICNVLDDPLRRGWSYLEKHAGNMWSYTSKGQQLQEQFAQLHILEITNQPNLVTLDPYQSDTRRWNFFGFNPPILTTSTFPPDLDTTSQALTVLSVPDDLKHSIMDEMLELRSADGLFFTYFDPDRPRIDPIVNANVFKLFHAHGRSDDVVDVVTWLTDILITRAYKRGSRYYQSPDWLFYYLASALGRPAPQVLTQSPNGTNHSPERLEDGPRSNSISKPDAANLKRKAEDKVTEQAKRQKLDAKPKKDAKFGPINGETWTPGLRQSTLQLRLEKLQRILVDRLQERMGLADDVAGAAIRLLAAQKLGLSDVQDLDILISSQSLDGSWEGWVYQYGGSGILCGNKGLVTSLALEAITGAGPEAVDEAKTRI